MFLAAFVHVFGVVVLGKLVAFADVDIVPQVRLFPSAGALLLLSACDEVTMGFIGLDAHF